MRYLLGEVVMSTRSDATEQELDKLTDLFRLLSDRTRLNIVLLLADGERNVTSLCAELRLPQPTVSHHLGLLRAKSIITNRRSGKQVFYTLDHRVDVDAMNAVRIGLERFDVQIAPRAAEPVGAS